MKKLIVNADDFGRAPGVNRGILDAHRNGIVTSTTIMINYDHAAPGLELAQTEAPDLGIGLHLNLTSWQPVAPPGEVTSLLDDNGLFHRPDNWATHFEQVEPDHIRREIEAQRDRFVSLTGHPPDHLDAHHHITYFHPAALQVMLEISDQFGIPMRNPRFELPIEQAVKGMVGMLRGMSETFATGIVEELRAITQAHTPPPFWPARFEMGFYDDHATLGDLLIILTNLPTEGATEMMCHPGYPDEHLGTSGYVDRRADEITHLTHSATLECVQAEGLQLITFGDLTR